MFVLNFNYLAYRFGQLLPSKQNLKLCFENNNKEQ